VSKQRSFLLVLIGAITALAAMFFLFMGGFLYAMGTPLRSSAVMAIKGKWPGSEEREAHAAAENSFPASSNLNPVLPEASSASGAGHAPQHVADSSAAAPKSSAS
jgi:hypothetical protein